MQRTEKNNNFIPCTKTNILIKMGKTEKSTYHILKYFPSYFIPIDDSNSNPFSSSILVFSVPNRHWPKYLNAQSIDRLWWAFSYLNIFFPCLFLYLQRKTHIYLLHIGRRKDGIRSSICCKELPLNPFLFQFFNKLFYFIPFYSILSSPLLSSWILAIVLFLLGTVFLSFLPWGKGRRGSGISLHFTPLLLDKTSLHIENASNRNKIGFIALLPDKRKQIVAKILLNWVIRSGHPFWHWKNFGEYHFSGMTENS